MVLSDSSPLITLGKIGLLDLLPELYTTITITPQIYDEVVVKGAGLSGSAQISTARWIEIKPVKSAVDLAAAQQRYGLGIGELSVIMLGHELAADLLLIDDMNARILAQGQGLTFIGCVGGPSKRLSLETVIGSAGCLSPVGFFRRLCGSLSAKKHSED